MTVYILRESLRTVGVYDEWLVVKREYLKRQGYPGGLYIDVWNSKTGLRESIMYKENEKWIEETPPLPKNPMISRVKFT